MARKTVTLAYGDGIGPEITASVVEILTEAGAEIDFDRIEVGATSAEWIERSFGPPDRRSSYDDSTEVWRYLNRSTSKSRVGLFLLFRVNVERDAVETLAIEMRDGTVSDYWVEQR